MTVYLSLEDILYIADSLKVGPVRDLGLLDSAISRPSTRLWGDDAYADLDAKAAVLLESIVRNHALIDGNKRLAWLSAVVFYGLNDVEFDVPDDEAYDLVVGTAAGTISWECAAQAFRRWRHVG